MFPVSDQRLADAIRRAEGTWTYGIKTVPVRNETHARQICLNTIRNNRRRWMESQHSTKNSQLFLDFLADRYCPASVDPVGNRNWKRNVKHFYGRPALDVRR